MIAGITEEHFFPPFWQAFGGFDTTSSSITSLPLGQVPHPEKQLSHDIFFALQDVLQIDYIFQAFSPRVPYIWRNNGDDKVIVTCKFPQYCGKRSEFATLKVTELRSGCYHFKSALQMG